MEQEAIRNEITDIIEKQIVKRDLFRDEVERINARLYELIDMLDDSAASDKLKKKVIDKRRFSYFINDTGNKDFTGYGSHFW